MLEAVAQESDGLSNAEISRKLNIPKSSASYILRTLETRGYLTRDPESGKYRVGLKILSLSRGALGGRDVRGVALPIMRRLTQQTGLTCHLAVLDGPEAVYIEKVEPEGFIRMDTWVGRRMRVHATSVGKAIVAHIPQEQLEQILRKSGMESARPKPSALCRACSRNWKRFARKATPWTTKRTTWARAASAPRFSTSAA
jgi:DNA-binding IclR family transcriptional regulator